MQALVRSGHSKSLWENSVTLQWTHLPPQAWPAINSGDVKKSCLRQLAYTLGKVDQFQMPVLLHLGRVYFKWAFRKSSCFYFTVEPSRLLLFRCCQQMHFHLFLPQRWDSPCCWRNQWEAGHWSKPLLRADTKWCKLNMTLWVGSYWIGL